MERVELDEKRDKRLQRSSNGGCLLVLGVIVLLIGAAMLLVVTVPSGAFSDGQIPFAVLVWMGLLFVIFGGVMLKVAWGRVRARRFAAARAARYAHAPWFADYPWSARGIRDATHRRWLGQAEGVMVVSMFILPFNFLLFTPGTFGIMPWVLVGLLDLFLLMAAVVTAYNFLQWLKFGRSRLAFDHFPFEPGGVLGVRLSPNRFPTVHVTLRYIEERIEMRGATRKSRNPETIAYCRYREKREFSAPSGAPDVPIRFDLPDNPGWVTHLTGDTEIGYWELLIEAERPGIDFHTTFPLPVYAGGAS